MKKIKDNRWVKKEELNEIYSPEKIKEGFQRDFYYYAAGYLV